MRLRVAYEMVEKGEHRWIVAKGVHLAWDILDERYGLLCDEKLNFVYGELWEEGFNVSCEDCRARAALEALT